MLGPFVAYRVRNSLGIESVFRVSAMFVFAMFWVTLLFYREPSRPGEASATSVVAALRNMLAVLRNFRFVTFLLIFSGFWVVFWQEFIALPLYLRGYVDPNAKVDLLLMVDPATVIALQILLSYATRKLPSFTAMTLGILIASISWLILAAHPSTPFVIVSLFVLALGEITQSPRYYEYVSRLAPPGQQGTYMGYAFLPVAIGYFIAGQLGGYLVHYFGDVLHRPEQLWCVISGVGFLTALAMWIYNLVVKPVAIADAAIQLAAVCHKSSAGFGQLLLGGQGFSPDVKAARSNGALAMTETQCTLGHFVGIAHNRSSRCPVRVRAGNAARLGSSGVVCPIVCVRISNSRKRRQQHSVGKFAHRRRNKCRTHRLQPAL